MSGGKRISVVIRCHNYGRFLGDAVDSVLAQTRRADEIVIVDDGSTDETSAVIAQLHEAIPHLVVVSRHPSRGAAASFNDGVSASTGDLVVSLDADDRLSANYLEVMERALDDSACAFGYAEERYVGAETGSRRPPPFDVDEVLRENPINVSAMFRRELFEQTGGFRPDFDALGLEDWEFWVHAIELGMRGTAVDGCWLEYRRHEGGSRNSMRKRAVLRAHLRVWRLHPRTMRPRHLVQWAARSVRRNIPVRLRATNDR